MKTVLLEKYFRGETSIEEETIIVNWANESKENMQAFLKERATFDT